jgi:hypothetical protein
MTILETAIDGSGTTIPGCRNEQSRNRAKELVKIALLTLIGIGISLTALRYLFVPLLVYASPESQTYLLDSGLYGAYPVRKYASTSLTSPQANVIESDDSCVDGLVLLSVGGQSVKDGANTEKLVQTPKSSDTAVRTT